MDAYDVKTPSHLEAVASQIDESAVQCYEAVLEKLAPSYEKLRLAVGDEYYEAFRKQSSEMSVDNASVFGGLMGEFLGKMNNAMTLGTPVDSEDVQQLVASQWKALTMIFPETDSKRTYLAIRDLQCFNAISQSDPNAAKISNYIAEAMEVFANRHFTEE